MCIMGDLNYPDIDWSDDGSITVRSSENSLASKFVDTINELSIVQNIHDPTFVSASGSLNTLDLVLYDCHNRISEIVIGPPLGCVTQGHTSIYFKYLLSEPNRIRKKTSGQLNNFRNGKYDKINNELKAIDWSEIFVDQSIEVAYNRFCFEYFRLCNKYLKRIVM